MTLYHDLVFIFLARSKPATIPMQARYPDNLSSGQIGTVNKCNKQIPANSIEIALDPKSTVINNLLSPKWWKLKILGTVLINVIANDYTCNFADSIKIQLKRIHCSMSVWKVPADLIYHVVLHGTWFMSLLFFFFFSSFRQSFREHDTCTSIALSHSPF